MNVHQRIHEGRLRLELTQAQFAKKAGVSRGAVQQWEDGTTAPKRGHQPRVAGLLGVSVAELMTDSATVDPPAGATAAAVRVTLRAAIELLAARMAGADEMTREAAAPLLAKVAQSPGEAPRIAQMLERLLGPVPDRDAQAPPPSEQVIADAPAAAPTSPAQADSLANVHPIPPNQTREGGLRKTAAQKGREHADKKRISE